MANGVPVLLMGFNRPECLKLVIDRLREVRASQVFIAIDGPRVGHPTDALRVAQCQDLVRSIDWECHVETLFRSSNLGCGRAVSQAITWFFGQVDEGIILEDDVVPDRSFFGFCEELLARYRYADDVLAVSGCNFVPANGVGNPAASYRFSRIVYVWGWASWRRAWDLYEFDLRAWKKEMGFLRLLKSCGWSLPRALYWSRTFDRVALGEIDTWDVQLAFMSMKLRGMSATANRNLVHNTGFGPDATHTTQPVHTQPVVSLELPTLPVPTRLDKKADAWVYRHHFGATLSRRLCRLLPTRPLRSDS